MIRLIFRHRLVQPMAAAFLLLAFAALAPALGAEETQPTTDSAAVETAETATPAAGTDPSPATAEGEPTQAIDFSGMIVQIDPKTGRLRPPTAEEAKALSRALARRMEVRSLSAAAHSEEHLENGAVMVELDPAFHDYTIARRAADGTLVTDCVHGADAALEVAQTPVEAPAEREVQ